MLGHASCGQEENMRDKTLESFYRVILLRESFDTKYALGWLDCTCDWTTVLADMVQATKDMRGASMKFRSDKLNTWSARDSGTFHLANLEGHELVNLGASQKLSIIPDFGVGAPSFNPKKCILEGAEDTIRVGVMKKEVKGKEVKEDDATVENHDEDKT